LKPLQLADNNTLDFWNNEQNNTVNHDYANDDTIKFIFQILDKLPDKRIRRIFEMRFYNNEPWKQISKNFKLSGTQVINLYNYGKKIVRDKLIKDNIIDKDKIFI
jgi:DNA-directed RNA polymerase specialized sigma subunit